MLNFTEQTGSGAVMLVFSSPVQISALNPLTKTAPPPTFTPTPIPIPSPHHHQIKLHDADALGVWQDVDLKILPQESDR
jgi:hypothetical protein